MTELASQMRRLKALLTACPTCSTGLIPKPGTSILECPNRYHGRFVIEENVKGKGGFVVTYEAKNQALR